MQVIMAFALILAVAAFVSAEEKKEDQDLNTAEGKWRMYSPFDVWIIQFNII